MITQLKLLYQVFERIEKGNMRNKRNLEIYKRYDDEAVSYIYHKRLAKFEKRCSAEPPAHIQRRHMVIQASRAYFCSFRKANEIKGIQSERQQYSKTS